jgi:ubiquinone/menaquinone biosynthesis C-methylase UbiE
MDNRGMLMYKDKEIIAAESFWNEAYKEEKTEVLCDGDYFVPRAMEAIFDVFTQECPAVLDFGCGAGDMLLRIAYMGKLKRGIGVEKGENIVAYASKMAEINSWSHLLEFMDGGVDTLKAMEDGSFDGVVASNVFDVITREAADEAMEQLVRILKPNGLMLLKVNQAMTPEMHEKFKMVNFRDNLYARDGVLRGRECTTEEWREWFSRYFTEDMYADVPWQRPDFFDRLFLLRKKL